MSEASLTHGLKHQVNVPVVLCPDHVQEADDVGMVPKFLRREPGGAALRGKDLGFPPPCWEKLHLGRLPAGPGCSPGAA